jgi:hypothetical protein
MHQVLESQFLRHRVPGSDSLAKYAAAFFYMSRAIFTSANFFRVLASSISISVRGLYVLPISPSLPALNFFTQLTIVDGGNESRRPASGTDSLSSVTSFTASSRNSLLYLPWGPLFNLTPPSFYFT